MKHPEVLGVTADPGTVTRILHQVTAGEPCARDRLMAVVYEELRRIARQRLNRVQDPGAVRLRPTELVHEAYIRLFGNDGAHWKNREHFYGTAADAMLHILIDERRKRRRTKHGGGCIDPLQGDIGSSDDGCFDLVALNEALDRLSRSHGAAVTVVKCKYILGMTETEIAQTLSVSRKTVHNRWRFAQAWLRRSLAEGVPSGPRGY